VSFSIVIPVRPPGEGKSRLAPALDERARAALVERMFRHVLRVATQVVPPVQCHVVSRSPLLLDLAAAGGARAIRETGSGLNAALRQASALVDPALPLLALSADLPLLAPADLAATDRAGIGTNALLLRRPGLIDYSFGADSLALHRARAMASGLRFTVMRREGLSADLDEPRDLALLARPSLSAA